MRRLTRWISTALLGAGLGSVGGAARADGKPAAAADWSVEGRFIETCDCKVPCPCWDAAKPTPPTHGGCQNLILFHVDKGHYGKTRLDGIDVVEMAMTEKNGKTFDQNVEAHAFKLVNFYLSKELAPDVAEAAAELFTHHLSFAPPEIGKQHAVKHVALKTELTADTMKVSIPSILDVEVVEAKEKGAPKKFPFSDGTAGVKFLSDAIEGKSVRYNFSDDGQTWKLKGTHGMFAHVAYDSKSGPLPWEPGFQPPPAAPAPKK